MSESLSKLDVTRKTGTEPFHRSGTAAGFDLVDFWRWSTSDLVSNITRGVLAEYIVARAVGLATTGVRDPWAAFDLKTPDGVKIEVKSAAYVQSWKQSRLSSIVFQISKTRAWSAETNIMSADAARQADVYVFALLAHRAKATIGPLN